MNQELQGLLDHIQASSPPQGALFKGELGETLLIAPRLEVSPQAPAHHRPGRFSNVHAGADEFGGEIVFSEAMPRTIYARIPSFTRFGIDLKRKGAERGIKQPRNSPTWPRGASPFCASSSKDAMGSAGGSVERLSFLAGAAHAGIPRPGLTRLSTQKGTSMNSIDQDANLWPELKWADWSRRGNVAYVDADRGKTRLALSLCRHTGGTFRFM